MVRLYFNLIHFEVLLRGVWFQKERREFNSINSGQLKKIFIIY